MSNTFEELKTKVRDILAEATAQFWTESNLNTWLADSILTVANQAPDWALRNLIRESSSSITSGVKEFTPATNIRVLSVFGYADNVYFPFDKVSLEFLRRVKVTADSTAYLWAETDYGAVEVYPAYNSDLIATTTLLRYHYIKVPETSGTMDLPEHPINLQELAVWNTVVRACSKDARDLELLTVYQNLITNKWNEINGNNK